MVAGQGLKRSLGTQILTNKDAHAHTNTTVQTKNMVESGVTDGSKGESRSHWQTECKNWAPL